MTEERRRISDLPEDERPLHRVKEHGPQYVSLAELLALVIGSNDGLDIAYEILETFGGSEGLVRVSIEELRSIKGVGGAVSARIKAAVELGRRALSTLPVERARVTTPADAANMLMTDMSYLEQEELRVILLDTRNRVIKIETIYKGNLNTNVVRIGELFRDAIKTNAAAIILSHNHPSGDPSPSPEDVNITRMAVEMGKALDFEVLDHIIIGHQRFVSLKERGLGFN